MADDVSITSGTGTQIAADNVSDVYYQKIKIVLGGDGAASVMLDDGQQNMAASLPVVIASDQSTLNIADTAAKVDDAAFTPATSYCLPTGMFADEGSTDSIDEGDVGCPRMTLDRRQIIAIGEGGANLRSGTNSATGTADTAVITIGGAGTFLYITSVAVYNSSATNTYVTLKSAATARYVLPAPAYGGCTHTFGTPLRLATNEAFNFASGAEVTTIYVSATGYVATA